jgi:threonine dehydratase
MERIEVTLRDIDAALPVVREVATHTPTVPFHDTLDREVWLKLENLQRLGAFKIRGVWNRLSRLTETERRRGVATISSGNHGLALAWAAKRLGLRCVVRVPEGAVGRKVDAIRAHGAEVSPISRRELVLAHEEETWRSWPEVFIHPFAHPATIAGQGTLGWELVDDVPDVRTVLVPVGGGGLAAGIGTAVKGLLPNAKVFGVQAEGAAPLPVALRTHAAHRIDQPRTIADGIGIALILPNMAEILSRVLDGCLVVSDREILGAVRRLALDTKVVAEPAGAAALAAWRRYRDSLNSPVAIVVSGGNVEPALLADVTKG